MESARRFGEDYFPPRGFLQKSLSPTVAALLPFQSCLRPCLWIGEAKLYFVKPGRFRIFAARKINVFVKPNDQRELVHFGMARKRPLEKGTDIQQQNRSYLSTSNMQLLTAMRVSIESQIATLNTAMEQNYYRKKYVAMHSSGRMGRMRGRTDRYYL